MKDVLPAVRAVAVALVLGAVPARGDSPFAVSVIDFSPAPGKFVTKADYDDPARALGPPIGAGTFDPSNASVVSLGGFGGSITLGFDHVVQDDPRNAFGVDAIVYGNAFWVDSQAHRHWAECGTIEIALDANGDGDVDPDEGWYLIPGSHVVDPVGQWATQEWDDDPDTDTPPTLLSWVPPGMTGVWYTGATMLPASPFEDLIMENPAEDPEVEGIYGYADYAPTLFLGDLDADNIVDDPQITPEEFYTVPDDPLVVGITPGSGGGDAFDIAWAVDPETMLPADLPGFNLIRLTNPTNVLLGRFGEKSPEIDAVADVAPDPFGDWDEDGDIDLADMVGMQRCLGRTTNVGEPCDRMNLGAPGLVDLSDFSAFSARLLGPQ